MVAVCSDKGAPGVTTLASALALACPGARVLLEADTSGGDAAFRMRAPGEDFLRPDPSVLTLAQDCRHVDALVDPLTHAQRTGLGLPVIRGPLLAEAWMPISALWPQITAHLRAWSGTVIVDVGRLQPGHPAFPLIERADAVLLLCHATGEAYFHARERSRALTQVLGADDAGRQRVGVVVRSPEVAAAGRRRRRGPFRDADALRDITGILQAIGSPVPVLGAIVDDTAGVAALIAGTDSRGLRESALMRSAEQLMARIQRTWAAPVTEGAGTAGRQEAP